MYQLQVPWIINQFTTFCLALKDLRLSHMQCAFTPSQDPPKSQTHYSISSSSSKSHQLRSPISHHLKWV